MSYNYNWNTFPHQTRIKSIPMTIGCMILFTGICILLQQFFSVEQKDISDIYHYSPSVLLGSVGIVLLYRGGVFSFHTIRAVKYLHMHKKEVADFQKHKVGQLQDYLPKYFVITITTYNKGSVITYFVYKYLFQVLNLLPKSLPIIVMAAVTKGRMGEQEFEKIMELANTIHLNSNVEIKPSEQSGKGKREALQINGITRAMEHLNVSNISPGKGIYAFIDGDNIITSVDVILQSFWFLNKNALCGGITTHNRAWVNTNSMSFVSWLVLRFLQRFIYQSSEPTVLTGRCCMIKSEIVEDPDFIRRIGEHKVGTPWFLRIIGTDRVINRLSGDDKTSFGMIKEKGYYVKFLAYVDTWSMEDNPKENGKIPGFSWIFGNASLVDRFGGNQLVFSIPLFQLGISGTGPVLFFILFDQWFSLLTALVGPSTVFYWTIQLGWMILWSYLVWLVSKAFIVTFLWSAIYAYFREEKFDWNPLWLYVYPISEKILMVVKLKKVFQLDQSTWIRQGISTGNKSKLFSFLMFIMSSIIIISFIILIFR